MGAVRCPNCGQPMIGPAVLGRASNGKKVVVYTCPNKATCRTVIQREE